MPDKPLFTVLTYEEFETMSLQQRSEYLYRLVQDIRDEVEQNRQRIEETNKRLTRSD